MTDHCVVCKTLTLPDEAYDYTIEGDAICSFECALKYEEWDNYDWQTETIQ